jgi:hypothetical protein
VRGENSGIPQGVFVKRHKLFHDTDGDADRRPVTLNDLSKCAHTYFCNVFLDTRMCNNSHDKFATLYTMSLDVGASMSLYARWFTITDADTFTRTFMAKEGRPLADKMPGRCSLARF